MNFDSPPEEPEHIDFIEVENYIPERGE